MNLNNRMTLIACLLCTLAMTTFSSPEPGPGLCYDRYGALPMDSFLLRSCALCYHFITKDSASLRPARDMQSLVAKNASDALALSGPVAADPRNHTTLDAVCASLSDEMCGRWRSCCEASKRCCDSQLATPLPPADASSGLCLRTWDGYSCWPDTPADSQPVVQCPAYIEHALPNRQGYKRCMPNGTWYQNQGVAWSDYTACLDKQGYLVSVYIAVAFNAASCLLLIPAVVIFASFRGLYSQHRVRLHINFFLSLALMCAVNLLWYLLVHYDLLVSPEGSETVIYSNPAWCRLLSFLKIYLTSSNYFWAFCEGFYLHHLIAQAFEPPKSLLPMYILGWGAPFVPAFIYGIMRLCLDNTACWAKSYGHYEWIIYGPNLICIAMNLVFLCNIMRILMFQLHSHPHEPSNFRRGLKAVFMLIPLFGLQLFLTIYRPPPGSAGEKEYEYMTMLITSSQGIFVSLIFCFFNGEVLSQVRAGCPCCPRGGRKHPQHQPGGATHMTMVTVADYDRSPSDAPTTRDERNGTAGAGYSAVPTYS